MCTVRGRQIGGPAAEIWLRVLDSRATRVKGGDGEHVMPRILVVDDDPMVCMTLEVCLVRHDFIVTIANGGESGLRALEDSSFDLMIVDIFMPHMRGFESIRVFHERAPSVPLVAMSGVRQRRLACPGLSADGARPRRDALSAQALHPGCTDDGDQ